jgi:hypothetical protein
MQVHANGLRVLSQTSKSLKTINGFALVFLGQTH